ncbi:MAG: hypothetical protein SWE60_15480 [Thermodesulfobacteriota bacterium]|nr:hypothetical protein [Thermodesulfobacteriota bacterium]
MPFRLGPLFVSAVALLLISGLCVASPPVPPPTEGFNIATAVDCEMSAGDFTETEAFTWTWVHDMDTDIIPYVPSTLAYPGTDQYLEIYGRAAQIRYTEQMQSTDTSFFQFKKGFAAASEGADAAGNNLTVDKNYGYVASEASLIANAANKERVGLSIVANGDTVGLGDMPSLCPWAAGGFIPATNEFIAMGSDTSTTSVMVSDSDTTALATQAPELNHTISAVGTGMAQGLMRVALMEGDSMYDPLFDEHGRPEDSTWLPGPPNLQSKTDYSEKSTASGTIEKFTKAMHYHSTIPDWQMPEPWYQLQ